MSKPVTPHMLSLAITLARDLRRDAMQDAIFPLSENMQSTLGAVECFWKGEPGDLLDAERAAAKWLGNECQNYTDAHGSTVGGSTLIAAKAFLLERMLADQAYLAESGAMAFSSPATTYKDFFLLLWEKVAPASEGWSNDLLRESLLILSSEHSEEDITPGSA